MIVMLFALSTVSASFAAPRTLLWGDTHLHTNNSFDAYLNRNMSAGPDTAYRYAMGLPVIHPFHRARVQIETPLDFLVIADHAEYLGVMRTIVGEGLPEKGDMGWTDWFRALYIEWWIRGVVEDDEGREAFSSFLPDTNDVRAAAANPPVQAIPNADLMSRTVWQQAIETADAYNDPGNFTTLIGWEWSSIPGGANLHRVVFTSADAEMASQFQPFASTQSMYPEDLWAWLDETSARLGVEFIAIPHNSNISKGYMFDESSLRGEPIGPEYAELRLKWEPVVEATQIKGDSETHPELSPDDPFAEFETYPFYIQQNPPPYEVSPGDYVRSALLRGLGIEHRIGKNPYRFGLIGSTDAHTSVASAEEPNFWGKLARDSIPEGKKSAWSRPGAPTGFSMSAQGLAAVWAEANTRQAILEAFRRREVYATTGPRILVRVFAGWDFEPADAANPAIAAQGTSRGVPMGGELTRAPEGRRPSLLIHAMKDPKSANLDRVQVVKGWVDASGATQEKVYDVTWSDGRRKDASGRVPPVGDTVDPDRATYTNDIGAEKLSGVWRDPEFDPRERAFYYVRVLEIPTPRHSVWDALALQEDPREIEGATTIQERAYTSPVWYRP